jgi:hypothetical protein
MNTTAGSGKAMHNPDSNSSGLENVKKALKKFIKTVLRINHTQDKAPEEIVKELIGQQPKKLVLITSAGVLKPECKEEEINELVSKFDIKVIMTGWDINSTLKRVGHYNADYLVCEGGSILYRKTDNYGSGEELCKSQDLDFVKRVNRHLLYAIQKYKEGKTKILFSQEMKNLSAII